MSILKVAIFLLLPFGMLSWLTQQTGKVEATEVVRTQKSSFFVCLNTQMFYIFL